MLGEGNLGGKSQLERGKRREINQLRASSSPLPGILIQQLYDILNINSRLRIRRPNGRSVREPPQDGANIRTIRLIAEHLRHAESARWSRSSVADRPRSG